MSKGHPPKDPPRRPPPPDIPDHDPGSDDPCAGPFELAFETALDVSPGDKIVISLVGANHAIFGSQGQLGLTSGGFLARVEGCEAKGWRFVGLITDVAGRKAGATVWGSRGGA